ncbi:MAG: baeRF10 domain-containing protein [Terriglobales bacterium]
MITRENIRELAGFESREGCALSFYYQPSTPKDKSHREELILVKDLVRNAVREAEKNGKNGCAREDLQKILELAERLHGNGGRAKAVFVSGKDNFWREFDLPARFAGTTLFVNRRFHLRPLTALADVMPRLLILVADKTKARFFELWMDDITEREKLTNELPRRGRSDGFAGYDAGHAERHVEHEAMHWYKRIAERMRELQESGYERFLVGCRDENWPEIEPYLHPYVRQRFVGHFAIDPATAAIGQVREAAEALYNDFRSKRRAGLIREAIGSAQRNGRGAIGLKRVLLALETGEVQTLLIARSFRAPAVQCTNCGHVDANMSGNCAVCAQPTQELEDVADALLRIGVRNGIEIIHIPDDPDLAAAGGVAALLRFRSDQNTETKKAG